jgi:phage baseplate assembly protein W
MVTERNQFLRLLQAHFNAEELKDLCFQLDIVHEDLAGETRSARMRSLMLYCERHDLSLKLSTICQRLRPNTSWPTLQAQPEPEPLDLEVNLDQKNATIVLGDRIDIITGTANDGDASQWRSIADKNKLTNPRMLQPGQALTPDTIVGTGWSFPLQISPQGGLNVTNEQNELKQSISIILMTAPGERLMYPTFGCRLNELCFMPRNKQTLTLVQTYIKEALQKWETRITVLDVQTAYGYNFYDAIYITISYEVKATHDKEQAQFIFYLMWRMDLNNQNHLRSWDGSPDAY